MKNSLIQELYLQGQIHGNTPGCAALKFKLPVDKIDVCNSAATNNNED